MPAWRVSLPKQSDDIELMTQSFILRTDVEMGHAKVRRRSTKEIEFFSTTLHFTHQQAEEFLDFWETDLGGGVLPFTWEHPITDAPATCRLTGEKPVFTLLRAGPIPNRLYTARLSVEILG